MKAMIISILLIGTILILIRNGIAYRIQSKASTAIYEYKMGIFNRAMYDMDFSYWEEINKVDYTDIEPYGVTMFKFWHNSWERVLPPEKVALIKPYLKEASS